MLTLKKKKKKRSVFKGKMFKTMKFCSDQCPEHLAFFSRVINILSEAESLHAITFISLDMQYLLHALLQIHFSIGIILQ